MQLNFAHTHGPDWLDFELIEPLDQGGVALALVRNFDRTQRAMVTTDRQVRVMDVYGTTEGESGDFGWGHVLVRQDEGESASAPVIPLVALRGLSCTEA